MQKLFYQDLTWPEVVELRKNKNAVIVQAVGAIEQHGPHLPLSTDTCQVDNITKLAAAIASKKIRILMAPTIPWGFSTLQMDLPGNEDRYPGTLTLKSSTLILLVTELCQSFVRSGPASGRSSS